MSVMGWPGNAPQAVVEKAKLMACQRFSPIDPYRRSAMACSSAGPHSASFMVRGSAINVMESVPQTTSLQKSVALRIKSLVESASSAVSLVRAQNASTLRQMSLTSDASTSRMSVHGIVPLLTSPIW